MTLSRWEFIEKHGDIADLPDLMGWPHLAEWLLRAGPVFQGGMGPVAVPHSELKAWAENIGLRFEGIEAEWLHKMSAAYAAEINRANGKDVGAPA